MALPAPRRFTVDEYYKMAEAGILGEDDRVELIEGEIVEMAPIGPLHADAVEDLAELFVLRFADRAKVRSQNPVRLSQILEPEPDLVLLRPRDDFYASDDATFEDVLLIVEVADSSIQYDRQVKAPLYARSGVPEYWIVDLTRDHVAVHRDPTDAGYATTRVFRRGETINPTVFPDLRIAVEDILA